MSFVPLRIAQLVWSTSRRYPLAAPAVGVSTGKNSTPEPFLPQRSFATRIAERYLGMANRKRDGALHFDLRAELSEVGESGWASCVRACVCLCVRAAGGKCIGCIDMHRLYD
jgi:hypothetical protein